MPTQTKTRRFDLAWITVNDLDKAIRFFNEVIGLEVQVRDDEMGWAELKGKEGAILGIATTSDCNPVKPGSNAIVTITVDNLQTTTQEIAQKGTKLLGEMMEVPGECKLQMFSDKDGNLFQLVEMTRQES